MPTFTAVDPATAIAAALRAARRRRHSDGCRCFLFRSPDGSPHCCLDDARLSERVDRLIDRCRGTLKAV